LRTPSMMPAFTSTSRSRWKSMLDSVRSSIIAATFRVNDRPNAKPNRRVSGHRVQAESRRVPAVAKRQRFQRYPAVVKGAREVAGQHGGRWRDRRLRRGESSIVQCAAELRLRAFRRFNIRLRSTVALVDWTAR